MRCASISPKRPSSPFARKWETKETWEPEVNGNAALDNMDKEEALPLVTQMRWTSMPSPPETPSAKKKRNGSWQKGDASSVSNKDTCPGTAQRSPVARMPPLPVPSPHETLCHPLECKPYVWMMRKWLLPHQNQRKEWTMSSTPLGTLMKEKGRS
jgi:hypothetical protein